MSGSASEYRLDGVYRQRQDGFFMLRVKLPAGVVSAAQARVVAEAAERFGRGDIHLTSRGSMEIHWLREESLPGLKRLLSSVGLTSRGACGGAVRGISCASQGAVGFPALERMAHRIHTHFTGNPRFERIPKKFKIGIEADTAGRRHLIQDVGLVATGDGNTPEYDLYVAGGLGREPRPGFLFEQNVSEQRVIPLIEAIIRVYTTHTPAGKRLKHLIREIGEEEFRRLVALEPTAGEELPAVSGLPESVAGNGSFSLIASITAGELNSAHLRSLADCAEQWSGGYLLVTTDQNIAFHAETAADRTAASAALQRSGVPQSPVNFRVCPGCSTCLVGLSDTRGVAEQVTSLMGGAAAQLSWAISGCPNSCTQPQLADVGIVTTSLVKGEDGERTPRFDLYRSGDQPFGSAVATGLTREELSARVRELG